MKKNAIEGNVATKVTTAKYCTSLDARGYIPVKEYTINGQPIMWDSETGYVHFTGIWKALGKSKADIAKMVNANPALSIKKVRGGYLKIQGTWIPMESAYMLCTRVAWKIRKQLVPLFGKRILKEAIEPSHPQFGLLPAVSPITIAPLTNRKVEDKATSPYYPYHRLQKRSVSVSEHATNELCLLRRSRRIASVSSNDTSSSKIKPSLGLYRKASNQKSHLSASLVPSPTTSAYAPYQELSSHLGQVSAAYSETNVTSSAASTCTITEENYYSCSQPVSPPTPAFLEPAIIYTAYDNSCFQYTVPPGTLTNVSEKETLDFIKAGFALQQLSQDNGTRPILPMDASSVPGTVIAHGREYNIHWYPQNHYHC